MIDLKRMLSEHKMWLAGEDGGSRAKLSGADLRRAYLSEADLSGADLRGASLSGADLRRADLSEAYLRGAVGNMSEVKSVQADLWPVTYTASVIQIGCQRHPIQAWWSFSDDEIGRMDTEALAWWRVWKPILQQIIEVSPAVSTGHETKNAETEAQP